MGDHVHLTISVSDQLQKDVISAGLFELDFDGVEEQDDALHAYVSSERYNETEVRQLLDGHDVSFTTSIEPMQNWNAVWESNFEPVRVDDFCLIRASFHAADNSLPYEVVITPKMSFGTGHHATTYLMVQQMRELDFKDKQVADFGTGTGVLTILAEKLGAKSVWAIDNDEVCIENATENIERNGCERIAVNKASMFSSLEVFDIILANINKNVIIDNLERLVNSMAPGGKLLLSGLLHNDEYDVLMACQFYNLARVRTVERNKWIAILLER